MKNRLLPLLLLSAGLSVAADVAEPDVQEVQTPEPELAPLANLVWRLPAKYATLDGDRLVGEREENARIERICDAQES